MTVKTLIDLLNTFPAEAEVEVITGFDLTNNWGISQLGVLYGDTPRVIVVTNDG